ncbi:MAG: glycoside hydrolase family 2 TIM barrel-domain containing protein [Candidatus Kapaibacteriota bacterium]
MRLRIFLIVFVLTLYCASSRTEGDRDSLGKIVLNSDTRSLFKLNGWWEVSVDGGDFVSEYIPKVFYNCERVSLRKTINLDKQLIDNSVWHLYFLGVNDEVELYWNGQFLGKYISDGFPLWITLPRKIKIKEHNQVEIVVSSVNSLAYQTRRSNLYYRRIVTGITRDFYLVRTPTVWINYISLNSEFENLGKVLLKTRVNISSFEVENLLKTGNTNQPFSKHLFSMELILRNQETKQVVSQSGVINFDLASFRNIVIEPAIGVLNPILWEPENPFVYELEVKLSVNGNQVDNLIEEIGFSKWDNNKLRDGIGWLLNGKPFILKAVDLVEDYEYYNSGSALKKIESDLQNLKSLGANAVRLLYSSPHPYFLSLANKYGILVLNDLPVYNIPTTILKKSDLVVRFQTLLDNIVKNCGTNPSLFAVGLGEGLDFSQRETVEYLRKTTSKLSQYTRVKKYISYTLRQEPIQFDFIDFYVAKDNFTLMDNELALSFLRKINSKLNKPVVYNFGINIDPTNHNGYNDLMSVEFQAFFVSNRYNIRNQVGNAGVIVWSYYDFITENPLGKSANIEPYFCYSGIINYKTQRISFNMLKALFNNEETPVVNPGQAVADTPIAFIFGGALAFILWGVMINRSRRFREHTFRSLFRTYNFFADIRDRRLISNWQTGIFGFVLSLIVAVFLVSYCYFYKTNNIFNLLVNFLIPNVFLKEWILRLSWKAELFVVILSILIFLKLCFLSFLLKFASLFVRSKIFISDTFKMVFWAGTPMLLLLPISIFVNRILPISPLLGYVFFAFFVLLLLSWLFRIIRSIWVVFDLKPSVVYLFSATFIFLLILSYISILEYKFFFFEYLFHYLKAGVL